MSSPLTAACLCSIFLLNSLYARAFLSPNAKPMTLLTVTSVSVKPQEDSLQLPADVGSISEPAFATTLRPCAAHRWLTWSFLFLFSPCVVHIQPWCCAEAMLTRCHYTSTPSSENHPTAVLRFVQLFNCLVPICLDACCCHRNTITRSTLWSVIYAWHIRMTYNYCFLCCPLLNSTQLSPTSHITLYLWLLIRFWGGF